MSRSTVSKVFLILLLVLILLLGVQLSQVNRPFTGNFASYQTVLASITDNILHENFSELFLPKTNLIILGGERSLHLNQYPFPSVFAAVGIKVFGGNVEMWGRLQAIIFNLLTALFLGLIAARLFSGQTGIISVIIYLLSPLTLIYGQSFMSEASSLFFLVLSLFLIIPHKDRGSGVFRSILSAIFFSLAVCGRLHFVVFLPAYLFALFLFNVEGKFLKVIIYFIFSLIAPAVWYVYTYFAGLHAINLHTSLFLQLGSSAVSASLLFLTANYYKQIFDIVSQVMLTPLLFPFLFLGLYVFSNKKKQVSLILAGLFFGGLVLILTPQKVMDHDFYLYGLFPFVVLLAACGLSSLVDSFPALKKSIFIVFIIFLYFVISGRYFLNPIFKSDLIEKQEVQIGRWIEGETQPGDKVIVLGKDTPILFYYIKRPAWSVSLNNSQKLPSYFEGRVERVLDPKEVARLKEAMRDNVKWLGYLRELGATYVAVREKSYLDQFPEVKTYLLEEYEQIQPDGADFYFFKNRSKNITKESNELINNEEQ